MIHQLDLNLNLEIYLFVYFSPPHPCGFSPKILAKDAPATQTLVCFPPWLLLLALQTVCSHDFVTDICEPKTEPFLAGIISNTTQLATFRKLFLFLASPRTTEEEGN